MSKKIKKIILIIAIIIINILGYSTNVNALSDAQVDALNDAFTSQDESLTLSMWSNGSANNLALDSPEGVLCIEGGSPVGWTSSYGYKYGVSHYIKFEGDTAKLYSNGNLKTPVQTVKNSTVALRAAYIMAYPDGENGHSTGSDYYSTKQYWIWHHFDEIKNLFPGKLNDVDYNNYTSSGYDADDKAREYANNYSANSKVTITDNTTKENVKLSTVKDGNNEYYRVGPYKWDYEGNISSVSVYDMNNKKIDSSNIKYAYYASDKIQIKNSASEGIRDNKNFYILIDKETNVSGISKVEGKVTKEYEEYEGEMWIVKHKYSGKWQKDSIQDIVATKGKKVTKTASVEVTTEVEVSFYGDLLIKKVDAKNPDKVLNNVGFIIKCTSSEVDKDHVGSYVTVKNGKVIYDKRTPQCFMTGTDGKTSGDGQIFIKDLDAGTYEAIEVTVGPNIYYKIEYTQENPLKITIEAGKTEEGNMKTATNTQEYVDISGYVWEDKISGKTSVRNALYNENDYDDNDILMNGIKVVLKDEGGNIVEDSNGNPFTATTKGKGYYIFKKVDTENLEKYHVEFEYDGLTYQNVTPHIDKDNGSKAAEGDARTTFNNKFTEITNNTTIYGKELKYTFENHVSTNTNKGTVGAVTSNSDGSKSETVTSLGDFTIESTTTNANLNIKDKFTYGMTEIKNINLGLYEREQPDLAIVKDIQNAKVMVNGYEHTYKYDTRADGTWDGDGFNVGVKFGNEYGSKPYTRAIYKSDVEFNPENDNELKVKVTYKIAIRNEATNLTSKVNSIVDYYDSKYTLEAAGTGLDNNGNITNPIAYTNDSYNNDYKKAIITTDTTIDAQQEAYIYVQFSMDRKTVLGIMFDANGKEIQDKLLLDNVAEINSYTTYKDGALYAGIDKDSRPGNAIAGNKDSYEDDTDAAPGLQLVVADARKITGSVFLDATSDELQTGEERLGNGKYDDGENTIAGIPVKLIDENGTTVKETTTDENGNFEISEFIPGKYQIVYIWGNKDYPVTDYKSTIWTSENVNEKNTLKEKWYTGTEKYSDAMDNYETRQKIDAGENITTMDATTPIMEFGVEFDDTKMTPGVDKVEFIVENVDFGIVERPRQKLDISKKVSHIKLTLANGQELFNTDVPWDGTIKGLTYMAPSANTVPANGYLKAEIDNELIQGSTIEITYTITVANKGEVDYDSENYYKYGTDRTNIIKVQPTGVYDYLDSTMAIDTTKAENSGWEIVSKEDYDNKYTDTIVEKYFKDGLTTETDEEGNTITKYRWETSEGWYTTLFEEWATSITESRTVRDTKLSNKTILHNSKLEEELEPGKETNVSIYTSKILANTDEIDLNNDVEITEVKQTGKTGRIITPSSSKLYDRGETTTVTPPTGENQNYILIIAISISALIILGTGIVFIKKKILK